MNIRAEHRDVSVNNTICELSSSLYIVTPIITSILNELYWLKRKKIYLSLFDQAINLYIISQYFVSFHLAARIDVRSV
jgi:hypothetical protein